MNFIQRWRLQRYIRSYFNGGRLKTVKVVTIHGDIHPAHYTTETFKVLSADKIILVPNHGSHRQNKTGSSIIKATCLFRFLPVRKSCEYYELSTADLERDRKEMIAAGISPAHVRFSMVCGALRSIVALFWYGLKEIAVAHLRKIVGRK